MALLLLFSASLPYLSAPFNYQCASPGVQLNKDLIILTLSRSPPGNIESLIPKQLQAFLHNENLVKISVEE